jgi:hypothetical protein
MPRPHGRYFPELITRKGYEESVADVWGGTVERAAFGRSPQPAGDVLEADGCRSRKGIILSKKIRNFVFAICGRRS